MHAPVLAFFWERNQPFSTNSHPESWKAFGLRWGRVLVTAAPCVIPCFLFLIPSCHPAFWKETAVPIWLVLIWGTIYTRDTDYPIPILPGVLPLVRFGSSLLHQKHPSSGTSCDCSVQLLLVIVSEPFVSKEILSVCEMKPSYKRREKCGFPGVGDEAAGLS